MLLHMLCLPGSNTGDAKKKKRNFSQQELCERSYTPVVLNKHFSGGVDSKSNLNLSALVFDKSEYKYEVSTENNASCLIISVHDVRVEC